MNQELLAILEIDDAIKLSEYLNEHKEQCLEELLHQAGIKGKLQCGKYLIKEKDVPANIYISDYGIAGPLLKHVAGAGHLDFVKFLVEESTGVDIESPGHMDVDPYTALCSAVFRRHQAIVDYLIEKGANVNVKLPDEDMLELGIKSGKLNIVKSLHQAGSQLKIFHLFEATYRGYQDIAFYLLELNLTWHRSITTLATEVARDGNPELLKFMMSKGVTIAKKNALNQDTHLHLLTGGASSGKKIMMQFLLIELNLIEECRLPKHYDEYVTNIICGVITGFRMQTQNSERAELIQYLINDLQLIPSTEALTKIIIPSARHAGIQINALIQLPLVREQYKPLLHKIIKGGLKALSIFEVFMLFNANVIIQERGFFTLKFKRGDFRYEIYDHIQNRNLTNEQLAQYCQQDDEFKTNALIYYSSGYHKKKELSKLDLLVEQGANINKANVRGEIPIHYAYHSGGSNNPILHYYLTRADLTIKDEKGVSFEEKTKHLSSLNYLK